MVATGSGGSVRRVSFGLIEHRIWRSLRHSAMIFALAYVEIGTGDQREIDSSQGKVGGRA
jgi:hypothetical protein